MMRLKLDFIGLSTHWVMLEEAFNKVLQKEFNIPELKVNIDYDDETGKICCHLTDAAEEWLCDHDNPEEPFDYKGFNFEEWYITADQILDVLFGTSQWHTPYASICEGFDIEKNPWVDITMDFDTFNKFQARGFVNEWLLICFTKEEFFNV